MNGEQRAALKRAIDARRRELEAESLNEPGLVDIPFGRRLGRGPAVSAQHGTETGYVNWKCRCKACTEAATEARKRRRHADPESNARYCRERRRRLKEAAAAVADQWAEAR